MQTLTIDLNGPFHYADYGGSGPAIVLVHGLGGSFINWMVVAPELAKSGRVLALDLPGFGRSPPEGRSVSIRAQVGAVTKFIQHVVADGPCTLVGNSMGGMISSMLAVERPELVSRVVLVNPALPRATGERGEAFVSLMLFDSGGRLRQ